MYTMYVDAFTGCRIHERLDSVGTETKTEHVLYKVLLFLKQNMYCTRFSSCFSNRTCTVQGSPLVSQTERIGQGSLVSQTEHVLYKVLLFLKQNMYCTRFSFCFSNRTYWTRFSCFSNSNSS